MWSVYLDSSPLRSGVTRSIGALSRRAYYGPFAPLRARQIRKAQLPGTQWVRVRNVRAGIAAEDVARVLLRAEGGSAERALPRTRRAYLGREVCGEVVEAGAEVQFLRVGDRVAYQFDRCCATREIEPPCVQCAAGRYNLCENRYQAGPEGFGGGWGDEMIVHERQLFLVPDALSTEQAALLEPAASALHAVLRHAPQPRDTVLVIGAGTLGLLTVQAIRALSPHASIIVEARHPFQSEMASAIGASRVLAQGDGSAGVAQFTQAKRYTRGRSELVIGGFDAVYDTVGTGESVQNALRWVRGGGAIVLAGARLSRLRLDLTPVRQQEIRLLGAYDHGTEPWPGDTALAGWEADSGGRVSTFQLAAALMRERKLTPERLVTHRFPLAEIRHAIRVANDEREHRSIKVLLDISDAPVVAPQELELADQPMPLLAPPEPPMPIQRHETGRPVAGRARG
jgi:threonine dehydrogenase-like Zn-dependent dehydrogenase